MIRKLQRQAGRYAGRQADKQTGRQADRQTDRQTDRQADRHTEMIGPRQKITNGTSPGLKKKSPMGPVPALRENHQWDRSQL